MQYKEYMLIYLTLISGLACTNLLHGMGSIIKRWSEISVDWVYLLVFLLNLFSIVDYWFHSFYFPYVAAEYNIFVFLIFLMPSSMLFFSTIILFPQWPHRVQNYTRFFKHNLRSSLAIYTLFIVSVLAKVYIGGFMIPTLLPTLMVTLLACLCLYLLNSVRVYKMLVPLILVMHTLRWVYQGIL